MTAEALRLVADSAAAFAAGHGGAARARQFSQRKSGARDAAAWRAIAEQGWFGVGVPESAGGLDLGPPAACLVAEAAGRALLMPPLTMGMAAASVLSSGGDFAAAHALQGLLAGERCIALAPASLEGDPAKGEIEASAVPDVDQADAFVVGVGEGAAFDARLVASEAPGVSITAEPCIDGSTLGAVSVSPAAWEAASRLARGEEGWRAWTGGIDLLRLGDAAYLCGLAAAAQAMSLDYLRLRRQFGVPIGSFQALQHRAADGHILIESTRALLGEAALAFGTPRQRWAAAAAVHRASSAARRVTQDSVQFHGAIGFADEHDAGLFLRRAVVAGTRHETLALRELASRSPPHRAAKPIP